MNVHSPCKKKSALEAARSSLMPGLPQGDAITFTTQQLGHYGERELETALAGPRATSRIVLALPPLGLLLGGVLGIDGFGALVGSGIAAVALLNLMYRATAALFAWSTGRTLVLPPAQRLYLVSNRGRAHGPFDFYDLELIAKGGGVITMEKYLELRTGRPTVDGCAAGKKCDGLTAKLRRLGATAEWRPRVDFLLLGSRYGAPGAAQAASLGARLRLEHAARPFDAGDRGAAA